MRKMNCSIAASILAVATFGGVYAFFGSPLIPTAEARFRDHPKLEAAYDALKDAKEYMEHQPHDFHGHRAEAIHAIDEAMHQISICVEEKRTSSNPAPKALASHEKLREAHKRIKEGREYLHESRIDFHGHKAEAIRWMDEALKQIQICMEID